MRDPWTRHKLRLRATAAVTWLVSGFSLVLLLAAVAPLAVGHRTYVVKSGSMDPAIQTGDMVVTEPIAPTEAEVGDIVTFRDPEGSEALITHRARLVRAKEGQVNFVTRGDANNNVERWSVPADGEIGRVSYRLPKLGSMLNRFGDGPARAILIAAPAILLLVIGLLRIWRPDEKPEEDPA